MATKTPTIPPILTITFQPIPGIVRKMDVRTPDEGALAVWAASGARFEQLGAEWHATEESMADLPDNDPAREEFRRQRSHQTTRALSRGLTLIQSVLANEADRDWIEDMLLNQRFGLGEALGILSETVKELRQLKPAGVSASGPAKKTRRVP